MGYFHDDSDSLDQLKSDIRLGDNPQHSDNPDSVRKSAREELTRRGFTQNEIDELIAENVRRFVEDDAWQKSVKMENQGKELIDGAIEWIDEQEDE